MTPEGLNFINYLQEIPYKVREVEYAKVYTNNMRIARVELRETALNEAEIEMAKYHIKNGCPEIVITYEEGDRLPSPSKSNGIDYTHITIDEAANLDCTDYEIPKNFKVKGWWVSGRYQENQENSFHGAYEGLTEDRLREKLREEEARENYEMCAEILKYAESKGFYLNRE